MFNIHMTEGEEQNCKTVCVSVCVCVTKCLPRPEQSVWADIQQSGQLFSFFLSLTVCMCVCSSSSLAVYSGPSLTGNTLLCCPSAPSLSGDMEKVHIVCMRVYVLGTHM